MYHPPEQEFFVADTKAQCPELLFRLHCPDAIKLIHGLCMNMLQFYSPGMSAYIEPTARGIFDDQGQFGYRGVNIADELPECYYTSQQGDVVTQETMRAQVTAGQVYLAFWPVTTIVAYARARNSLPDYLVGEEHFTKPLIYQALYVAHEWRVQDLKFKVRQNGIHFGSATGWNKSDFMEEVKDWPTRFNFAPRTRSPLPHENPEFYAEDQAIYNAMPKP